MTISYAIPVCNEHNEILTLLSFLIQNKRNEDEIVVQCDQNNTTKEVYEVIAKFDSRIKVCQFPLKGNFADFKNNLKNNCSGDWIFQIDADEMLGDWLIQNLPQILQDNPEIQLFCLPRINTVEGLTQEHIQKWGWQVNEKGWVNFPDVQTRIIQNSRKICWVGKVHEVIYGHTSQAIFPILEEYCILHHKNIQRQEIQNTLYNLL
jgi:glycosyltransferase involved in cell wall biosynthesis